MGSPSGPDHGPFVVLALFAMKLIPSFLEFRTAKTAIERIAPTAQTRPTRGARSTTAPRSTTSTRSGEGPRDHARRQPARHRLRLPQGSAAVRPGRTVHRLRGELERPVALLGHSFADARLLERALAPQPRPGPQRAARVPRRRRARLRGRRRALRALPQLPEGKLTQLRASLVRRDSLARGAGLLADQVRAAITDSVLADCVEALIGAIFLDGGYPGAPRGGAGVRAAARRRRPRQGREDAKTRLQELCTRAASRRLNTA